MTRTRFKLPPRIGAAAQEIPPPHPEDTAASYGGNLQAVLAVHEAMLNGARAIARHNLEIFWQTMTALSQASWAWPDARPARMGIEALRHATANLKDLDEIIHHANAETLAILNRRLTAVLEEMTPPPTSRGDTLRSR